MYLQTQIAIIHDGRLDPHKTNITENRIFDVTFDRNKIESCGFHRRKEQMKTHRKIY
jgi:hypothetical protein